MELDDHPTVKRYREKGDEAAASKAPDIIDADWLKKQVLEAGADELYGGYLPPEWDLSIYRADVQETFPRAKTLVSFVSRLNPENIRCTSQAVRDLEFISTQKESDGVARKVTRVDPVVALRSE